MKFQPCVLILIAFCFFVMLIIFSITPSKPGDLTYMDRSIIDSDILRIIKCYDKDLRSYVETRAKYYILYNLVKASNNYKCHESITLTSPGDFRFLDNVIELAKRWDGPISIALYAPGDDFYITLDTIAYLRKCTTRRVMERVSFSLFFETEHMPKNNETIPLENSYKDSYDCSQPPPWDGYDETNMYKMNNSLLYPINVARNVAKLAAQTHFVFPSDIELYPTPNFIMKFFELIVRKPHLFIPGSKNVFVVPIFEVMTDQTIPKNKTELQRMLSTGKAIMFHEKVCKICHRVPRHKEWVETEETSDELNVFTVAKRVDGLHAWEPFFVCTDREPLWDERLTWEGQGNKMPQAFHLCMLDYDFVVLDNAFLIHKPGVKKTKVQNVKYKSQTSINNKILKKIQNELYKIYGHKSCKIT